MRKSKKIILILLLIITVLIPAQAVSANTDNTLYTYTYDWYGVQMKSPDAYTVEDFLLGSALGIGNFLDPKGLFVRGEKIYIVDSGNSRIVVVNKDFQLERVIDRVIIDGEESTFKNPQDVFVSEDEQLYICDTDNYRILHVDKDLNLIKIYTKPEDETLAANQNFIPLKCVVDTTGRLYLLAGNINKGLMEFDRDGNFTAYVGANKVKVSFFQSLQKRLMTKAQRARMELFVPTEYSNIAIDSENFIYATTTTFDYDEVDEGSAKPIRKLNSLGNDILIRNGYWEPVGDIYWGNAGDVQGPSRFEDVTAMDNDTYFLLDRVRGRIFGYDFQGNMLYAFGGLGNKKGYFQYPVAIDHMGTDLIVLDNRAASVTRFTLTEYGELINKGLAEYKEGRYDESSDYWRQVLQINGNYDLAYIGIGRSLLRQEQYYEAMQYFKAKVDDVNYSKAFAQYRKQWVEENIEYLIGGFLLLIFLPKVIRLVKKVVKGEVFKV